MKSFAAVSYVVLAVVSLGLMSCSTPPEMNRRIAQASEGPGTEGNGTGNRAVENKVRVGIYSQIGDITEFCGISNGYVFIDGIAIARDARFEKLFELTLPPTAKKLTIRNASPGVGSLECTKIVIEKSDGTIIRGKRVSDSIDFEIALTGPATEGNGTGNQGATALNRCIRLPERGTVVATVYNAWPDGRPALNELAGFKTLVGMNDEVAKALAELKHGSRVEILGVEDDHAVYAKAVRIIGKCN